MDRRLLQDIMAFVAVIVGMGCLTGVITSFFAHRRRAIGSNATSGLDLTSRLDAIAARLEHLDTAVDTVAVEVERISEAQRFTARVLAERNSPAALPDKGRSGSVTPH